MPANHHDVVCVAVDRLGDHVLGRDESAGRVRLEVQHETRRAREVLPDRLGHGGDGDGSMGERRAVPATALQIRSRSTACASRRASCGVIRRTSATVCRWIFGSLTLNKPELDLLAELPRADAGPVFDEPWQAQAFALVLELHARGVLSWQAWTEALAAELRAHEDRDGTRYYHHWLSALERLVGELGIADREALAERKRAWRDAYRRTPHGMPVIAPRKLT